MEKKSFMIGLPDFADIFPESTIFDCAARRIAVSACLLFRSSTIQSSRMRLLSSTARAAGMALTLAAATAADANANANDVRILMRPQPGTDYIQGRYYLIPQPYAAVKGSLEQGFAAASGLRGFQLRDDTAALSDMEFYWVQVGARHLPALR
ncbi:MAG: hypothetical protein JO200_11475, partial [Comamonas sp.]|nr:hypothetical protein [Comamonas sp.]